MRARQDQNQQVNSQSYNEIFEYDSLNRLTSSKLNGVEILSMSYSDNGNTLTKSDVSGVYGYGNADSACASNFAGSHAVTSVGSKDYCYDARGNQTHAYDSGVLSREIQYGYNDKPVSIISSSETTNFVYDSSNNRIKRVDIKGGTTETTYYLDGIEYSIDGQGITQFKRYLDGFAIQDIKGSTVTTSYVHTDHLGSMDVFTDESGNVNERLSFDSFGDRRNALGWQNELSSGALDEIAEVTKRGFTGHEHIDHADIIHMNGRIYDAKLGRFVQADPVIQEVKNSQNYNRYSYVLNNPLSYTDPTGLSYEGADVGVNFATKNPNIKWLDDSDSAGSSFKGKGGDSKKLDSSHDSSKGAPKNENDKSSNGGSDGQSSSSLPDNPGTIITITGKRPTNSERRAHQREQARKRFLFTNIMINRIGWLRNHSIPSGMRFINPLPDGFDGPLITFFNNITGGASTDLPVRENLADVIEDASIDTGFSINIDSTTGGSHTSPAHPQGRAADINIINNIRLKNGGFGNMAEVLERSFVNSGGVNQVLGPNLNVNVFDGKQSPITIKALINAHKTHIHVNVPWR